MPLHVADQSLGNDKWHADAAHQLRMTKIGAVSDQSIGLSLVGIEAQTADEGHLCIM